ncbi:hypothetical protein [Xanthocytophaga agilis]|uniref:Uncharacterized protein n=1 Tax=Xanthocytophaga agilis TaxID=3048010 RepID=A0AAE3UE52_9BACT|nr:hypothetical protein [Xanthocytophaga agilis]MDJ1499907.1 hypothetical protein [Xanthocytophaga agilis]
MLSVLDSNKKNEKYYQIVIDNDVDENACIIINQDYNLSSISISIKSDILIQRDINKNNLLSIFVGLLRQISSCDFALCRFNEIYNEILLNNFGFELRTKNLTCLNWLQYFGKEELELQGGMEALEANPLLKTERIHDGLLIQVGESPYDAFTPQGEELLVKATRSLPPVKK